MLKLMSRVRTALRAPAGERGAALTEYGILLALIAAVVIGTITLLGERIDQVFADIVTAMGG